MYIGQCIIVIVEEKETNLVSQFIKFYFTSSMLNMFRTLMPYVAGWGGIRVTGFSLPHGYHPNQPHRNSNTHRNKKTQPMW